MKYRILLLQGPVGGYFSYLHQVLEHAGFEVRRLLFNGGDWVFALRSGAERVFCRDGDYCAVFTTIFEDFRPDAVVLFGDERPIHKVAIAVARKYGIEPWCFEEGYIRPDHVTFEQGGNNANSRLGATFDRGAADVRSNSNAPRLRGQSRGMILAAITYFVALRSCRRFFAGYTHHRERKLRNELKYWLRSVYRRVRHAGQDKALVERILAGGFDPFYLLALQVHDDLQLRKHGLGWRVMPFTQMVIDSFKATAPRDCHLIVKAHPLDLGHGHHGKNIHRIVARSGLAGRVHFLQTGPVLPIVRKARGIVTINSTVGLSALSSGVPVIAYGKALYHIDGLSSQPDAIDDLHRFWSAPPIVDRAVANAFRQHILDAALLPGSFYVRRSWPGLTARVCETLKAHCQEAAARSPRRPPHVPAEARPVGAQIAEPPRHRVGIVTRGVWRKRNAVAALLEAEPVRLYPGWARSCDLVVGWGYKKTAASARRLASRRGIPFVAVEDGFLRSVRPGRVESAIGWIVDRQGIYYDAAGPSDFEAAVTRRASEPADALTRGADAMRLLRDQRLSKYNHGQLLDSATLGLPHGRDVVLVIDQTVDDASVRGADADATTFAAMLDAAIAENPGRTIAVKLHPETVAGTKRGYLPDLCRGRDVVVLDQAVNPWCLLERAVRVYAVSSQLGLEALIAGVPVSCFGHAAYSGWGLTDDRGIPIGRRRARPSREAFVAAAYLDYCRWLDPYTSQTIPFETAIERLVFLRDRYHDNRRSVCVGFSTWKQRAVRPFLTGVDGPPLFARTPREAVALAEPGTRFVVWGNRPCPELETVPNCTLVRAEDGFLRSVGLGAAFVKPASLVFDSIGIHYDPTRPSTFEVLAATTVFDDALIERAKRLRKQIVERGLSKYNDGSDRPLDLPRHKTKILVPGQVEDDASVHAGAVDVRTNLGLLRRVRERWPDAYIVYKPHPDVQAGYRTGKIPLKVARSFADRVVTDVAMPRLLADVDRVETITSLTGFEALLRGIDVTTHGAPFYAGWGLTEDLVACPRRKRRLTLDELVAVALISLPKYFDEETALLCPVETITARLERDQASFRSARGHLFHRARHAYAWAAHKTWGKYMAHRRRLRSRPTPEYG